MLSKGIDTTIRELIEQLPNSSTSSGVNSDTFEKLVASLAEQIGSAIVSAQEQASASAGTSTATTSTTSTASTTTSALSAQSHLNAFQLSLLRDKESPLFEQLSNDLTAGDPQYNQREAQMRDRLDLNTLESRLQQSAREYEVTYDRSDLDGILRNAGYDAAHLGSSERYMAAIEKYVGEANNNYRQRSTNIPGQTA